MKKTLIYAPLVTRVFAALIDSLIFCAISISLWLYFFMQQPNLESVITDGLMYLAFIGFPLLLLSSFYMPLLTAGFGATIGKMVAGIEVQKTTGGFLSVKEALFRELIAKVVSTSILWAGFFAAHWSPTKQGWHDELADTYVVEVSPRMPLAGVSVVALLGLTGYLLYILYQTVSSNTVLIQDMINLTSGFLN